jgi:NADH:ubiquinone oxidoreductase subunit 6 (subunit J)
MTRNIHYVYACLLVMVLCASAFNLQVAFALRAVLGLVLLSSAIIAAILLKRMRIEGEKHVKKFEIENATLKATLNKSEDLRARLREKILEMSKDKEKFALEPRGQRAEQYLASFHQNYVVPYLDYLMNVEMPLSVEVKQKIVNDTVELAMLALDMADAYDWDVNNRAEQRIVCGLLLGQMSKEEALAQAVKITDNPYETPKWVRALSESLRDVISLDSNIILSGYKD